MITKTQSIKLKRLVNKLIQAHVNDSWKGGGDPSEIPTIEQELKKANQDYNTYIESLVEVVSNG